MKTRSILALSLWLVAANVQAVVLNFFPASIFSSDTATMDAALGITGYLIENFEDTTLIAGLSITYDGDGVNETRTSLTDIQTTVESWDGVANVNNTPDNIFPPNSPGLPKRITFNFNAATSVGVGLSGFQSTNPTSDSFPITNHTLYVNGIALGNTLEFLAGTDWTGSRLNRNLYLRLDATGNETITSIGFENIVSTTTLADDVLHFDHLAFSSIAPSMAPEPATLALLGLGLAGIGFSRRKAT